MISTRLARAEAFEHIMAERERRVSRRSFVQRYLLPAALFIGGITAYGCDNGSLSPTAPSMDFSESQKTAQTIQQNHQDNTQSNSQAPSQPKASKRPVTSLEDEVAKSIDSFSPISQKEIIPRIARPDEILDGYIPAKERDMAPFGSTSNYISSLTAHAISIYRDALTVDDVVLKKVQDPRYGINSKPESEDMLFDVRKANLKIYPIEGSENPRAYSGSGVVTPRITGDYDTDLKGLLTGMFVGITGVANRQGLESEVCRGEGLSPEAIKILRDYSTRNNPQ
ncbi:hypothetical protein JW711_02075 [Candidatus Woesearchaeota archaeon]|nr:hypothetical protein [Candidatus Woesearchaeota archaeon]